MTYLIFGDLFSRPYTSKTLCWKLKLLPSRPTTSIGDCQRIYVVVASTLALYVTPANMTPPVVSWKRVYFLRLTAEDGVSLEWPCYLFDSPKQLVTTVLPRTLFWSDDAAAEITPLKLSPDDARYETFVAMAHALWIEECLAEADPTYGRPPPEPVAYLFGPDLNCSACYYPVTAGAESELLPFIPNLQRIVADCAASRRPSCLAAIRQVMQVFRGSQSVSAAQPEPPVFGSVRYALVPRVAGSTLKASNTSVDGNARVAKSAHALAAEPATTTAQCITPCFTATTRESVKRVSLDSSRMDNATPAPSSVNKSTQPGPLSAGVTETMKPMTDTRKNTPTVTEKPSKIAKASTNKKQSPTTSSSEKRSSPRTKVVTQEDDFASSQLGPSPAVVAENRLTDTRKKTPLPASESAQMREKPTKLSKASTKKSRSPRAQSAKKVVAPAQDGDFATVHPLLIRAGYRLRPGHYQLPSNTPLVPLVAHLSVNEDYFATTAALRRYLCAAGVSNFEGWTEQERDLVRTWVRTAIVRTKEDDDAPEQQRQGPYRVGDAYRQLLTIGFSKVRFQMDDYFALPGVAKADAVPGSTMFSVHERDPWNVYNYLTRFGFPETCDFTKLSFRDQVELEQFIIDNPHMDTL
jgi:hypothetical protein